MDRKRIIEEGLLERSLLDSLSDQEHAQLSAALEKDHSLRDELIALESEFELLGFANAVEPSPQVKQQLMQKLSVDNDLHLKSIKNTSNSSRTLQSGKLLVAASLAALFALGSFWLYIQWQSSLEDFRSLQDQTISLRERLNSLEDRYESTQSRYVSINSPDVIPLYLVGNDVSPESRLVAYVNHNEKKVIVNTLGLPQLDRDKTYQMWADVEGEMINMGILEADQEYIPVRYIDKAESLNITIEPAGGSEHPTVEQLISNIYL